MIYYNDYTGVMFSHLMNPELSEGSQDFFHGYAPVNHGIPGMAMSNPIPPRVAQLKNNAMVPGFPSDPRFWMRDESYLSLSPVNLPHPADLSNSSQNPSRGL